MHTLNPELNGNKSMRQVLSLPALLVLLLILMMGVSIFENSHTTQALVDFTTLRRETVQPVSDFGKSLNRLSKDLLRLDAVHYDAEAKSRIELRLHRDIEQISADLERLRPKNSDLNQHSEIQELSEAWNELRLRLESRIDRHQTDPALTLLVNRIESIVATRRAAVTQRLEDAVASPEKATRTLYLASILGLIFGLVSTLIIVRRIRGLLVRIAEADSFSDQIQLAISESAMVLIVDRDHRVTYVNEKFSELSGFSKEEILGKNVSMTTSASVPSGFAAEAKDTINSGNVWSGEIKSARKDGGEFWASSTIVPVRDLSGEISRFISIRYDISQRKDAEFQLSQAKEAALTAAKTKAVFLATMSHEIRTPMNGILGMCDLLLTSVADPLQLKRIKIIQNCSTNLINLLSDVLDFSKLEVDKIELENVPYSLKTTVAELIELFRPNAEEKGVRLAYEWKEATPDWITGDCTRFRQILSNLVSNAVKFTEQGSVRVRCSSEYRDGNPWIRIDVKDTGVGMDGHAQEKLFVSFSQVDASTTRKFGGTGLGLAISKGLTDKMGGRIWCESAEGEGSTFSFIFPTQIADLQVQEASEQTGSEIAVWLSAEYPLLIIVAEDNEINQLVLLGLLNHLGYVAEVVTDGVRLLEKMKVNSYDLVLMDCYMPNMDGFECAQQIRALKNSILQPRIVAVTASMLHSNVKKCLDAGMDEVLHKPIDPQQLKQVLIRSGRVMDKERFMQRFRGMESVAHRMIEGFIERGESMLEEIEFALAQQNFSTLQIAAHTLKGLAATFYADTTAETAGLLEEMAEVRDLTNGELQYRRLAMQVGRLIETLSKIQTGDDVA